MDENFWKFFTKKFWKFFFKNFRKIFQKKHFFQQKIFEKKFFEKFFFKKNFLNAFKKFFKRVSNMPKKIWLYTFQLTSDQCHMKARSDGICTHMTHPNSLRGSKNDDFTRILSLNSVCFSSKSAVKRVWLPYAPFQALYAHNITTNVSFYPFESPKHFWGTLRHHTCPPNMPKPINSYENGWF